MGVQGRVVRSIGLFLIDPFFGRFGNRLHQFEFVGISTFKNSDTVVRPGKGNFAAKRHFARSAIDGFQADVAGAEFIESPANLFKMDRLIDFCIVARLDIAVLGDFRLSVAGLPSRSTVADRCRLFRSRTVGVVQWIVGG